LNLNCIYEIEVNELYTFFLCGWGSSSSSSIPIDPINIGAFSPRENSISMYLMIMFAVLKADMGSMMMVVMMPPKWCYGSKQGRLWADGCTTHGIDVSFFTIGTYRVTWTNGNCMKSTITARSLSAHGNCKVAIVFSW